MRPKPKKKEPVAPKCDRFLITDYTWAIDVTILIGHSQRQVARILKKQFGSVPDITGLGQNANAARTWWKNNSTFAIWIPAHPSTAYHYSVLQHEIFHVADVALRGKGIRLSDDSDEAYAYLIQNLTAMTYSKLWKRLKK